jgi:hypothetical protein
LLQLCLIIATIFTTLSTSCTSNVFFHYLLCCQFPLFFCSLTACAASASGGASCRLLCLLQR